ncbi:MAG: hypothetical protein HZB51_03210 [Chloroflexi bacterium]|nr:hypothetical protein [Chloroflexota bacterium]
MRNKVFSLGTMVFLASLFVLTQSTINAAPLAICISTVGGGDWANAGTWQFCTGSNPPATTDDVYIQGPVTLAATQTAANVTVSNGGSLNPGANTLTANSMIIDAGGLFTGSLTLNGNLTNNGSFNGSGQTVIINGTTSVGGGATFTAGSSTTLVGALTNNGTFNCGGSTVAFQGNLTNNNTLNCGSGTCNLNGDSVQNVGGSGTLAFNNLTLTNAAGVVLNKDATLNGTLTFTNGDLNTGSNILNLASGATVAGTGDVVGNVKRTHAFSTATNYQFNSQYTLINFSVITTTAPSDITINLAKSTPGGLANAVPRTYSVTANGAYSAAATLQLHYKSAEGGFTTEANLRPWKQVAGRWALQPGSVTAAGNASFVSATGVTSFSNWAISDSGAPTAVTLSSFKANTPSFDLDAWLGNLFGR